MALPVSPGALRKLLQEVETSSRREQVLAIGGAPGLASELRQQFFRGGADPAALRLGDPDGATAYVHVLGGEGEEGLRRANRARVPAIAVAMAPVDVVPYVLATDVVRADGRRRLPLDEIARAVAARLGEDGAPLAARVPLLREPVCEWLIESFARKNGLFAAAVWIPGPDLPVLTLNELRLVLRLAQAHGEATVRERLPWLAATIGAGFVLRTLARVVLDLLPAAGWVAKGAVAYAGTRAIGETVMRPPAAAVPGAP